MFFMFLLTVPSSVKSFTDCLADSAVHYYMFSPNVYPVKKSVPPDVCVTFVYLVCLFVVFIMEKISMVLYPENNFFSSQTTSVISVFHSKRVFSH